MRGDPSLSIRGSRPGPIALLLGARVAEKKENKDFGRVERDAEDHPNIQASSNVVTPLTLLPLTLL